MILAYGAVAILFFWVFCLTLITLGQGCDLQRQHDKLKRRVHTLEAERRAFRGETYACKKAAPSAN